MIVYKSVHPQVTDLVAEPVNVKYAAGSRFAQIFLRSDSQAETVLTIVEQPHPLAPILPDDEGDRLGHVEAELPYGDHSGSLHRRGDGLCVLLGYARVRHDGVVATEKRRNFSRVSHYRNDEEKRDQNLLSHGEFLLGVDYRSKGAALLFLLPFDRTRPGIRHDDFVLAAGLCLNVDDLGAAIWVQLPIPPSATDDLQTACSVLP
jgi:hypothetical protein